jgi:hypothetical protein
MFPPRFPRSFPFFALALLAVVLRVDASPGEVRFGREHYIEYRVGDLPIILTASHGGDLAPAEIADRTRGVFSTDRHTREVAFAAYEEIVALTGRHPHLIISHLLRRKLDPNRPLEEAAQGDPHAERAWHDFHGFIAEARAAVVAAHGRGILLDIHGHGHAIPRVELGYALGAEDLNLSDEELNRPEFVSLSTLRPLTRSLPHLPLSLLVRGPGSFGDLLNLAGLPAWPSPQFPHIGDAAFFRGGYIVRAHSNLDEENPVAAIQAELPFPGMRDTEENRARFAAAFASSVIHYLKNPETFAFTLPTLANPISFSPSEGDLVGCGDGCANPTATASLR